jgi:SAM-dependent methyltransferase
VEAGRTTLDTPVLRCEVCGYTRTSRLPEADPRQLHEGRHPSASQGRDGKRFPSLIARVRQFSADYRAREAFAPGDDRPALDFGCGQGFYLGALRRRGFTPTGLEISAATAQRAMATGHRVVTSLDRLEGERFAAMVSIHVIEHLDDPDTVLGQLVARLDPDARFLVEVPNATGWQGRLFGERWLHRESALHVHHFSPRALRALLARHGFRIERESHYSFEHGLLGWVQSLYNLAFPYNRFFRHVVLNNTWGARLQAWPEILLFPIFLVLGGSAFGLESLAGSGPVIRLSGRYESGGGHARR